MTSQFLKHIPCGACGSSDANSLYSDHHQFCHACRTYKAAPEDSLDCSDDDSGFSPIQSKTSTSVKYTSMTATTVIYKGIPERGITKETCEKYRVFVNQVEHYYPYFNQRGEQVGDKVRTVKDKSFTFKGDSKASTLFGQQLFLQGGKYVTIYEGELDAMSGFQMTGSLYPSVSIKNGASGALKDCKAQFEWLDSFENIVVCFDGDEPGQKAAKEVAELFGSKAKIVKHLKDYKDASDYLQKGATKAFVDAWWRAEEYRPEGVVTVRDIKARLLEPPKPGLPWCFPTLTKLTYGRRQGELYGFGAGVGVGKTDVFTQQISYDLSVLKEKVGVIYLEQNVAETAQRVAGKLDKKLYHIPDAGWSREEYEESVDRLEAMDQLYMMDHWGAKDWASVKTIIRYFAKAYGVKLIYLDHLTALIANEQDERRALDGIMADMATLAQSDGLIIHFVSHLTTPEGKSHEEGGRVLEKHFTGSRAIARWGHYLFGLERDKQHEDPVKRQTTTFRVLKDRYAGSATAEKFGLIYDRATGYLNECTLDTTEAL
jgi:twinkle protein